MPRHAPRRQLLVLAGLVGVGLAIPALLDRWRAPSLDLVPLRDPDGFRRLRTSAATGGLDPLAGLAVERRAPALLDIDLCTALFGPPVPAGVVPIAAFSDYVCPSCRVLAPRLERLRAGAPGAIHVVWHEWPILGEASRVAARAVVAARLQGADPALHAVVLRGPLLSASAIVGHVAERSQLDPDGLRAEMESAAVAAELGRSAALAVRFGFVGTPTLVVGRTVVEGAVDERMLRSLVARERADGPLTGCGTR